MHPAISRFMPGAAGMIRSDHSHVLDVFHRYRSSQSPDKRAGLVNMVCLALEIHTQLEEELFYPACRVAGIDQPLLESSTAEHAEIRRLIAALRSGDPASVAYDRDFMELMRTVLHHMADEETRLLPDAERALGPDRLAELGAQMTRRRLQLSRPHAGELVMDGVRSVRPASLALGAAVLVAGGYVVKRVLDQRSGPH